MYDAKASDKTTNSAIKPVRRKGIHLGFSNKNSAWLIGTYKNGCLSVYETRAASFVEDVLVRDITKLNEADPSTFEQLLNRSVVAAESNPAVGISKGIVGEVDEYMQQGLITTEWQLTLLR